MYVLPLAMLVAKKKNGQCQTAANVYYFSLLYARTLAGKLKLDLKKQI